MPPFRPILPSIRRRGLAPALVAAVLFAACGTAATPRPSNPPDATGSLLPPITATPPPSASPSAAAAFPTTLTDDEGTAVMLKAEPQKIVSLTPATTEILFALGVGDRIVGKVEDFTPYPPEATAIPDVAKFGSVDVEKIVSLNADVVIAGGNSFNPPDKIVQLRKLGIPVVVVYAPDVKGVLKDIELTGAAVGKSAEAKDLTASMQAAFDQVAAATAEFPKPRVFYELDATQKIYTAADDSFLAEMITLAGGMPITTGSTTNFEIPLERLVTADPELILLGDAAYGTTADAVKARSGWKGMTAVKNSAIVGVDDVIISRPGPRLVDGLRALALAIHPDAAVPPPAAPPSAAPAASASAAPCGERRRADDRRRGATVSTASAGERIPSPRPAASVRSVGRPRSRATILVIGGFVALAVALVLGVALGTVAIAPGDTLGILAHRLLGIDVGGTWSPATETIVWDLRLPRVLTAMSVGAGLAVAGATFQGLLRNPLADPYVLGTASGAALGAAIAVVLPIRATILGFGLVQVLAFAGALGAVFTVYRLSRIGGLSPLTSLLLTGYAVGSLLAAGLAMAMYLSGAALRQIFAYLLGGFDTAGWSQLGVTLPIVAVGSVLILLRARSLDGLLLGEDAAVHLGVDVRKERAILLALASLVTAAAVAVSGLIGFVGLVVPHVVRLVVGPGARRVLPLAALGGAALMAFADLAARMLGEIPVGVVTAVIGAPFFLSLLRRTRTGYEL